MTIVSAALGVVVNIIEELHGNALAHLLQKAIQNAHARLDCLFVVVAQRAGLFLVYGR
jgi:hypothetical protein